MCSWFGGGITNLLQTWRAPLCAHTLCLLQGMTLDRAEVSLEKAFEPGMAYVALRWAAVASLAKDNGTLNELRFAIAPATPASGSSFPPGCRANL